MSTRLDDDVFSLPYQLSAMRLADGLTSHQLGWWAQVLFACRSRGNRGWVRIDRVGRVHTPRFIEPLFNLGMVRFNVSKTMDVEVQARLPMLVDGVNTKPMPKELRDALDFWYAGGK